jgi:hypothetical protein
LLTKINHPAQRVVADDHKIKCSCKMWNLPCLLSRFDFHHGAGNTWQFCLLGAWTCSARAERAS